MKNKFTVKLTLYFMAVLVIFTIVVGGVFHHLFKENTVEQKRKEMSERFGDQIKHRAEMDELKAANEYLRTRNWNRRCTEIVK